VRSREKITIIVAGLVLLAAAMVACGPAQDPDDEIATATASAQESPAEEKEDTAEESSETESAPDETTDEAPTDEPASAPETAPEGDFDIYAGLGEDAFETTDSGLRYVILEEGGGGERPVDGQVVSVHYTGWLEDGSSFDSSIERGQPFSFPLGQQMVIAGWDEGIALLSVGDKARLIIPGDLAYGEAGRPGIPSNATLIFDVELMEIAEGPPESPAEVDEDDYEVSDTGLKYYDLVAGDGVSPEPGLAAMIHFTLWLEDGTMLGSTVGSGQPVPVSLGSGQLFAGWEEGLATMQVGGSRQLVIPPELAFGETGTPDGSIPPNATIIIEVELLDVIDPAQ
jgi:peptidylprolyl isomerase